jgi:hypothetical protein
MTIDRILGNVRTWQTHTMQESATDNEDANKILGVDQILKH